jgi:hypothetical protein
MLHGEDLSDQDWDALSRVKGYLVCHGILRPRNRIDFNSNNEGMSGSKKTTTRCCMTAYNSNLMKKYLSLVNYPTDH